MVAGVHFVSQRMGHVDGLNKRVNERQDKGD